jgi:hypothetical protein
MWFVQVAEEVAPKLDLKFLLAQHVAAADRLDAMLAVLQSHKLAAPAKAQDRKSKSHVAPAMQPELFEIQRLCK